MRGWSVEECNCRCGRVARESGRGAARTWKGAAQPEKRRNNTGATARGHGAARANTNESRQHRAARSARARPHTDWGVERLQEWSRSTSAANEAH